MTIKSNDFISLHSSQELYGTLLLFYLQWVITIIYFILQVARLTSEGSSPVEEEENNKRIRERHIFFEFSEREQFNKKSFYLRIHMYIYIYIYIYYIFLSNHMIKDSYRDH